jgi:DNA-binding MarR family transcriptional regulator
MQTQDDKLVAWKLLVEAHAFVMDGIERALEQGGGVQLTWYEVLSRLRRAPAQALRMQDLAEQLLLSRSGATRLIDRIEAAGLIERRACTEDRRGTLAVLTSRGDAAFRRAQPLVLAAVQERFGGRVDERDARELQSILQRLIEGRQPSVENAAATPRVESARAEPSVTSGSRP